MKLIILRSNLKEGLSSLERAISDNENLPILKNVLLKADKQLVLSATNLEIGATYSTACKVSESGSLTVPFSALNSIISNSVSERINLVGEGENLLVKTDNYEAKIQGVSAEDFPIIPKIENKDKYIEIDGASLKASISEVVPATQVSDLKPELNSVLFDIQLGTFKLAATDGFRLAEKTLLDDSFSSMFKQGFSVIVPLKTISEVLRIFKDDSQIKIFIDPHQISFETERLVLISRLIDGNYPDYTSIIPKESETEILLDREEFLAGVKLVSSFAGKGSDVRVRSEAKAKNLEVYASSKNLGENNYLIPAKKQKGDEIPEMSFNWRYLIDGIKPMKGKQITLGLTGPTKPAIIKPANDQSLFYIVMPINES